MSKYKVSEPSALKFLKANGAVVDENGNVVNEATDYWKKVYDQAEPKVAKYLHADGTIDENPGSGGGGADLEDNKTATIDVSTYTEPVEVLPSEGKDGMKKATVSLDNIPKIEANKAQTIDVSQYTEPVEIEPTSPNDAMAKTTVTLSNIPEVPEEVSFSELNDDVQWIAENNPDGYPYVIDGAFFNELPPSNPSVGDTWSPQWSGSYTPFVCEDWGSGDLYWVEDSTDTKISVNGTATILKYYTIRGGQIDY